MPRNGSGTHSVPNTFSSGTTIGSSQVNGNFSDIASEITNSLPRDGQAAMTGQFKASTGTVSQPGISFGSDTNTGFYRKAADTIGIVCGGAEVGSVSSAGLSENLRDIPSGSVMLFYQAAAPTGWTQNTDAGAVHNKALRVVSTTGGGNGGSSPFTSVFAARTITTANMPAHTHGSGTLAGVTNTTGNHSHTQTVGGNLFQTDVTGGSVVAGQNNTNTGTDGAHSHTVTINSGATASAGSGEAMDFAVAYLDLIVCTRD